MTTSVQQLSRYGRTPEEAVSHYVKFSGEHAIQQTKPLLKTLATSGSPQVKSKLTVKRKDEKRSQILRTIHQTKWSQLRADEITRKMSKRR